MELSELTAYAEEKYHIREQHKWMNFPGWSVLTHPRSGKWIALLMRQWDTDTGTTIERCDIKCGRQSLSEFARPYLSLPIRMEGGKWIGAAFDHRTEPEIIFKLFDRAMASEEGHGYTITLETMSVQSGDDGRTDENTMLSSRGSAYRDTPLPFAGSAYRPPRETVPERLRQMKHLYEYGRESREGKALNFYRQGMFMKDYEDNVPWSGPFVCYSPTYHDLTTRQLRGYFTWRAQIRKGICRPIPASAAYIYLYELLNGIGTVSPEDGLRKMKEFETGYLGSGLGDNHMLQNLQRWMLDFSVLHDLPPETAEQYADRQLLDEDQALAVLKEPQDHSDEEVFTSLCRFARKTFSQTPVVTGNAERGRHLFAESWRAAASGFCDHGKDLFTLCFGQMVSRPWFPLANAVCVLNGKPETRSYVLNKCRIFECRSGIWRMKSYERLFFDRSRFQSFLHETDLRLRRYLKTGRYLQEKPEDAWADPFIRAVIEADTLAMAEAARPKITIDLSGLDRIRRDAQITQESLLTEDDTADPAGAAAETAFDPADSQASEAFFPQPKSAGDRTDLDAQISPVLPLDEIQVRILRMLLRGESASEIIAENRLMPAIVADSINEALFDEIGDTVLTCEDDVLSLVEDYREDLEKILG